MAERAGVGGVTVLENSLSWLDIATNGCLVNGSGINGGGEAGK